MTGVVRRQDRRRSVAPIDVAPATIWVGDTGVGECNDCLPSRVSMALLTLSSVIDLLAVKGHSARSSGSTKELLQSLGRGLLLSEDTDSVRGSRKWLSYLIIRIHILESDRS
jgi:hypothetical protein